MTNSATIADHLDRQCDGSHEHIVLASGNRTGQAQIYPKELCEAILEGLKEQLEKDGRKSEWQTMKDIIHYNYNWEEKTNT